MSRNDWQYFNYAENCHICDEPLVREQFLDSRQTFDMWTGKYAGQSHKRCFFKEQQTIIPVVNEFGENEDKIVFDFWAFLNADDKQPLDSIDKWIQKINKIACFVANPCCKKILETRFFSGYSGFPLSPKTNIWFHLIYLELI